MFEYYPKKNFFRTFVGFEYCPKKNFFRTFESIKGSRFLIAIFKGSEGGFKNESSKLELFPWFTQ